MKKRLSPLLNQIHRYTVCAIYANRVSRLKQVYYMKNQLQARRDIASNVMRKKEIQWKKLFARMKIAKKSFLVLHIGLWWKEQISPNFVEIVEENVEIKWEKSRKSKSS